MRIVHVVGTRPNFVKMAPVIAAARRAVRRRVVGRRAHGPALRPGDVGGLLRGARRPRARPHARGRLRQPRRADGPGARAARAGAAGRAAGPDPRPRRRQLDARSRAVRGPARDPDRPHRVRAAQLRPHDARGDQPGRHRPPLRAALPALARGRGQPARGGGRSGALRVRRQHDDRHAGRARGPDPRARGGARRRRRARFVPAGHPAPTGARRRAAPRRRDHGARAGGRRAAGRLPGPSADAKDARRARRRRSAADRPGRLSRFPLARGGRRRGTHRLRRDPGGDDLPRRPVLHAARQHRAPGDGSRWDEHAARARAEADRRDPGAARRGGREAPRILRTNGMGARRSGWPM